MWQHITIKKEKANMNTRTELQSRLDEIKKSPAAPLKPYLGYVAKEGVQQGCG
jgi:hypothetical protein